MPAYELPATHEPASAQELMTVKEVARRLRVDATTVRRWIKNGALEAVRLPHIGTRESYRIRRSTLEGVLKAYPPSPYDKAYAYQQALASLQEPSEEEYRQIALAERATEAMLEDSL